MKLTNQDIAMLMLSCPVYCTIGIPLIVSGYLAGLALIVFGFINLITGIVCYLRS